MSSGDAKVWLINSNGKYLGLFVILRQHRILQIFQGINETDLQIEFVCVVEAKSNGFQRKKA